MWLQLLTSKTEREIRTEKCSDTCQHNIKFVLTFTKNDLTLVETYTITLKFGLDTCQIKVGIVQVNAKCGRKMSDVRLLFHALYMCQNVDSHMQEYKVVLILDHIALAVILVQMPLVLINFGKPH